MKQNGKNLYMVAGDRESFVVTLNKAVTSTHKVIFKIKEKTTDEDASIMIESQDWISDRQCRVTIPGSATASIKPTVYYYEVKIEDPSGDFRTIIECIEPITNAKRAFTITPRL